MCQISEYWHLVDTHTFTNTYYLHGWLQFSCQMWGCLATILLCDQEWRGRSRKKFFVSSPEISRYVIRNWHPHVVKKTGVRPCYGLEVLQQTSFEDLFDKFPIWENTTWCVFSCFFLEGAGNRSGLSKQSGVNALMALHDGLATHLERVVSVGVGKS